MIPKGLIIVGILVLCYVFNVGGVKDLIDKQIANTTSSSTTPPATPPATPPTVSNLVGKFNADNNLSITVNGQQVYSDNLKIGWGDPQNVNIPNVKSGDVVRFIVSNAGGPGGLIGSFTWNGKRYDTVPATFATPSDYVAVSNPTAIWGGGITYPGTNAQWIWDKNNCGVCNVTFTWTAPAN